MSPIQQMLLGAGGSGADPTYMDDIFNTYVYEGNGTAQGTVHQIVNGIDNTKGGLVWIKNRDQAISNMLLDTERVDGNGDTYEIKSDSTNGQAGPYSGYNITAFNANGFKLEGNGGNTNENGKNYVSWNMREAKGFFDIVTWSGNGGGNRAIDHDLGVIPGVVILKRTDATGGSWYVHHRSLSSDASKFLYLQSTNDVQESSGVFGDTAPTATQFTAGWEAGNTNNATYVAYLFAGGESTAAEAVSVKFDGDGDYLSLSDSDLAPGAGAFTIECWVKPDSTHTNNNNRRIWRNGDNNATGSVALIWNSSSQKITVNYNDTTLFTSDITELAPRGQWTHLALVREGTGSNQTKLYLNGVNVKEGTLAQDLTLHAWQIGTDTTLNATNASFNGEISNVRFVIGTAVYTSSFRPPTAPLANITNTELLCCNNSSTIGKTVGPTITANGNVVASTDSPFDDPAGFAFGPDSDQNVIKTGSYTGSGGSQQINVGFEPQWLLVKCASDSSSWILTDSMRGIVNGQNDKLLIPNDNSDELSLDRVGLTSTGFETSVSNQDYNANGDTYIYIAIRRSDGYVGKPAAAGTSVFTMDTGNDSSNIPAFDSNFIVDFALYRKPAVQFDWTSNARLTGTLELITNSNAVESGGDPDLPFDSNVGYAKNRNNGYQAWMWKRHAGLDVVSWRGQGGNQTGSTAHSLGVVPQMIWNKRRDGDPGDWIVYHEGLNGGTNPEQYYLNLNDTDQESQAQGAWNYVAPTATHFSTGTWSAAGAIGWNNHMITMLFASVDGISKVGFWTSNGSNRTEPCGFRPRLIIVRKANDAGQWKIFDTLRGLGSSGNDELLRLEANNAPPTSSADFINTSDTGFTTVHGDLKENNKVYIYYAHA